MSKFAVGDKVLITATTIPNTGLPISAGSHGEIEEIVFGNGLPYLVKYKNEHGKHWWFSDEHLEFLDGRNLMPELEMGLDEIHLAQEIMEGLR